MDLGNSLNPQIDIGQIEGAFVQGMGWCTMEECVWGDKSHKWVRPPPNAVCGVRPSCPLPVPSGSRRPCPCPNPTLQLKPGSLLTRGPGFYKIPSFNDVPIDFRVSLLRDAPNPAVRLWVARGRECTPPRSRTPVHCHTRRLRSGCPLVQGCRRAAVLHGCLCVLRHQGSHLRCSVRVHANPHLAVATLTAPMAVSAVPQRGGWDYWALHAGRPCHRRAHPHVVRRRHHRPPAGRHGGRRRVPREGKLLIARVVVSVVK